MTELRPGDVLVTWESSRTGRRMPDFLGLRALCESKGVLWCVGGRVFDLSRPEDRHSLTAMANDAELETARLSKRIKRAARAAVKEGIPHQIPPWGYRKARTDDDRPTLEFDPVTSQFVREAVDRLLRGERPYSVATDFNERGIMRPTSGKPWKSTMLMRQLTLEAYTGYRQGIQGNWPVLITPDERARLQALTTEGAPIQARGTRPTHLLSGIATCSVCGDPVGVVYKKGRAHYRCPQYGHVSRLCGPLDKFVTGEALQAIEEWAFDVWVLDIEDVDDEHGNPAGYRTPANDQDQQGFAALRAQAAELRAQAAELLEQSKRPGRKGVVELLDARDDLIRQADELDSKATAELSDPLLDALCADPATVWKKWGIDERRAFLRGCVAKLDVLPLGKGKRARYPDSVRFEVKLPDRHRVSAAVIRAVAKPYGKSPSR
ncbi:recombinase family protein [Nocardia nova]|uniref:recombinase family protein n=1 Tax=Nocardia nova TaxID=37330 RepID=UPI0033CAD927